jgi:HK97 family phage major capsid protein
MISNKSLIQKADLALSELTSGGGALSEAKSKEFLQLLIKKGVLTSRANVKTMAAATHTFPKIRFGSRIIRAGASGQALAEADRSKPEHTSMTLNAQLFKAEIQLPDEIFEDNIEGVALQDTILALVAEQMSADVDDIVVNSNTANAALAPELKLFDGMLAKATTNTVAAGGTVLTKDVLKQTLKAMPREFQQDPLRLKFFTSINTANEYGDGYADRMTGLGDEALQNASNSRYRSIEVLPVPLWPENLGGGTDESAVILCDPKEIVIGFWRTIKMEMERSARHGTNILVASMRMDFDYMHEPAVVKTTGIKVSAA